MIESKLFNVGIYIRLSKEDLNKNDKDSYSVQNQKLFLENYVNDKNYILKDIYIDDGYTGTNFDRPGFKRLLNDINIGKINMVVTKDLSRLGRDYIETGEYVEKFFPLHNVRYVSVLDGIDTFFYNTNNDIAPFKAVINDMYSRDNSKKIRTALISLKKDGKWLGSCPPLGYKKDPFIKNHLVINEDESYIIKKIFNYALQGLNCYQIKEKLIEENIPTTSIIRNKNNHCNFSSQGIWSAKTVSNILKNQIYIGDLVQNKRSRVSYKIRKMIDNAKTDWILVNNTHEAIIDREVFFEVQNILKNYRVRSKKENSRLLDGLLYCRECKHKITICKPRKKDSKTYTVCNTYKLYSKQKLCTPHSNNYDSLEKTVLDELKKIIRGKTTDNNILTRFNKIYERKNLSHNYNSQLYTINNLIQINQKNLDKMYIDKLESKITVEMYERVKLEIENNIQKYIEMKVNLDKKIEQSKSIKNEIELYNQFINYLLNLEKKLIIKLIKKIEITKDKQINVYFNFCK